MKKNIAKLTNSLKENLLGNIGTIGKKEYKEDQYKQEVQLSSIKQKLAFWGGVFTIGNLAIGFLLNRFM